MNPPNKEDAMRRNHAFLYIALSVAAMLLTFALIALAMRILDGLDVPWLPLLKNQPPG